MTHLYILSDGSTSNRYKVGKHSGTYKELLARYVTYYPRCKIHLYIECESTDVEKPKKAHSVELDCKTHFSNIREVNVNDNLSEWYLTDLITLRQYMIKKLHEFDENMSSHTGKTDGLDDTSDVEEADGLDETSDVEEADGSDDITNAEDAADEIDDIINAEEEDTLDDIMCATVSSGCGEVCFIPFNRLKRMIAKYVTDYNLTKFWEIIHCDTLNTTDIRYRDALDIRAHACIYPFSSHWIISAIETGNMREFRRFSKQYAPPNVVTEGYVWNDMYKKFVNLENVEIHHRKTEEIMYNLLDVFRKSMKFSTMTAKNREVAIRSIYMLYAPSPSMLHECLECWKQLYVYEFGIYRMYEIVKPLQQYTHSRKCSKHSTSKCDHTHDRECNLRQYIKTTLLRYEEEMKSMKKREDVISFLLKLRYPACNCSVFTRTKAEICECYSRKMANLAERDLVLDDEALDLTPEIIKYDHRAQYERDYEYDYDEESVDRTPEIADCDVHREHLKRCV